MDLGNVMQMINGLTIREVNWIFHWIFHASRWGEVTQDGAEVRGDIQRGGGGGEIVQVQSSPDILLPACPINAYQYYVQRSRLVL